MHMKLLNEFSKAARYKVNTISCFAEQNNEQSKKEITIALKKIPRKKFKQRAERHGH